MFIEQGDRDCDCWIIFLRRILLPLPVARIEQSSLNGMTESLYHFVLSAAKKLRGSESYFRHPFSSSAAA
jgi:hypothetical protein